MNESEFENELRALRPSSPSAAVGSAIRNKLGREIETISISFEHHRAVRGLRDSLAVRLWNGLAWAAGGALAAAVAFTCLPGLRPSAAVPPVPAMATAPSAVPATFLETGSSLRVVKTEIGGLQYDAQMQPSELLRYSTVERHTWQNPATGARLEVEVPREDVVLVPVSFQ